MDINMNQPGGEGGDDTAPSSHPSTPEAPESGPSPEDMAAHDYKILVPKFLELFAGLPKKQMFRVMKAMIEYPFEDQRPKFSYEMEKKLFHIGMSITDCAFVMKKYVLDHIQKTKGLEGVKSLEEAASKTVEINSSVEQTENKESVNG